MRPIFQPCLVNGPFADPALFVDVLFERRALLFDLGDITALPPRKILRTSHVFVTHTHMDHFVGFDRLLRICLGRARPLTLFGPAGFIEQVHHRLASYTWNLVENYSVDLAVTACEVSADGSRMSRATFNSRERFLRRDGAAGELHDGLLLDEPALQVRCAVLDHGIPCLGFALQEAMHVNVWPNRLAELGLVPGAWLRDAKRAIIARRQTIPGHGAMARRHRYAKSRCRSGFAAGCRAMRAGPEDRLRLRRRPARGQRAALTRLAAARLAVHRGDVSRSRRRRGSSQAPPDRKAGGSMRATQARARSSRFISRLATPTARMPW